MIKNCLQVTSLLFFSILLCGSTKAQLSPIKKPGITVGGNVIYSIPKGSFDDLYQYGAGAEVYGGVGLGKTYLLATIGYTSYKAETAPTQRRTYVPIKLGIKQFFLLKRIFIQGDLGIASTKMGTVTDKTFAADFGAGVRLFGLEAGLFYDTFKPADTKRFNSLNAKLGWSISL